MNKEEFLALLQKAGVATKASATNPTASAGFAQTAEHDGLDDPPAKKARTELAPWTMKFEYQNRYGYRRYSRSDGSHVEVKAADDARIPFKVQTETLLTQWSGQNGHI